LSYLVVITPARDEQRLLPGLISSMVAQTHLPQRWIVVDDGSADADLTFAPDFIASLLAEFRHDAKLGIAGPVLLESDGGSWREVNVPSFHVRGAAKMYSGQCFSAIGGLQAGLGWDTIDELHAMMLGFHSRHFCQIKAYHHRPQGTAGSLWRARWAAGRAAYRSGYSTLFMFVRAANHLLTPPYLLGSAMMLAGYFEGFVRREPRAASPEVIRFVRQQQLRRLLMLETLWR
jgi:biofilm PGA synthesis N-glycosyltransferase PgaC